MSSTANTTAPKKVVKKAAEAAAAPVVAAAVEEAKKVVKKAAVASAAPVVTTPSPSPAVADPVVEAAAESSDASPSFADEMKALQDQLTAIRDSASAALATLKRVGKRAAAEIKDARKKKRRARAEGAEGEPAKPNNFTTPLPISDELSVFLGGGKGNQMSIAQVKSAIHKYVNEKNLRVKHDITPDAPLRKLLAIDAESKLTIFNIQTYLRRHFIKPAAPAS
jgi:hypothetical protein